MNDFWMFLIGVLFMFLGLVLMIGHSFSKVKKSNFVAYLAFTVGLAFVLNSFINPS